MSFCVKGGLRSYYFSHEKYFPIFRKKLYEKITKGASATYEDQTVILGIPVNGRLQMRDSWIVEKATADFSTPTRVRKWEFSFNFLRPLLAYFSTVMNIALAKLWALPRYVRLTDTGMTDKTSSLIVVQSKVVVAIGWFPKLKRHRILCRRRKARTFSIPA